MARYIDVDKFVEKICDFQAIDEDAANKMIWLLRTFPTADVAEVVRCKDCLFSCKDPDYEYGYMCYKSIYHPCIGETRHRKLVQDIDFCSCGKRKKYGRCITDIEGA